MKIKSIIGISIMMASGLHVSEGQYDPKISDTSVKESDNTLDISLNGKSSDEDSLVVQKDDVIRVDIIYKDDPQEGVEWKIEKLIRTGYGRITPEIPEMRWSSRNHFSYTVQQSGSIWGGLKWKAVKKNGPREACETELKLGPVKFTMK